MRKTYAGIKRYVKSAYLEVCDIISEGSIRYAIWHFSLLAVLWGIWILNPAGEPASTVAGYEPMVQLASMFTWGSISIILGAANMHFVQVGKNISAALFSLLLGYFWALVGISYLTGNPPSAGGVIYLMLSLFNFWVYKRLHG